MIELINNRYRILQTLGSAGGRKTFLAEDSYMPSRRRCVIKQLHPVSSDVAALNIIQERFEREVAILEKLGVTNDQIPALHAYFIESEKFYLVQDWIEGQSLTEKVRTKGVFSESEIHNLLINFLPVLECVHSQGIIHGNIKPENIILREIDDKPVLTDFGKIKEIIATEVDAHGTPTDSIIIGSSGFTPLEQVAGKPVFASDLYSLGLTAIYLLTGKRPNEMSDLVTGEIAWLKYASSVSSKLVTILNKVISPIAQDRYRTAQEMQHALQSANDKKDSTVSPPPITPKVDNSVSNSIPVTNTQIEDDSNRITIPTPNAKSSSENIIVKPWALLVAFLYFFVLVILTLPELLIAFFSIGDPTRLANIYLTWQYWIFILVLVLCQVALLKVPVGIANRRPISRRSLLLPIIVIGLMVGLLVVSAIFSLIEFINREKAIEIAVNNIYSVLIVGILIWVLWSVIFYRMSRNETPKDLISKLCRGLFAGSALELLIAVPTHIIARSRDYCCAGAMTFIGITLGIAIMLLSFGPGVFFLFQERWNRLHKYRLAADDSSASEVP